MSVKTEAKKVINKFKLDRKTWTYKGAPSNLHFFFPVGEMPLKPVQNYYSDSYKLTLFYITEGYVHWWWNNEDMHRLRESFIKRVSNNPKFLKDFAREYEKRALIIDKFSEKVTKINLSKLSYKQLFNLYEQWYREYINSDHLL